MNEERMRRARARLWLQQNAARFLFDPARNVNAVDYGMPIRASSRPDDPTLRFHVAEKLSPVALEFAGVPPIPPRIGEFETDVIVGNYRPQLVGRPGAGPANDDPLRRHDPLRAGISISDEHSNKAGTLGCLVRDRQSGRLMLLSNWHVIVTRWTARRGQGVLQPGRLDGGRPGDLIGRLERHAMDQNIDAAVALLEGPRQVINDLPRIGAPAGIARASLGTHVEKFGRTTRYTEGVVTGVDGVLALTYDGLPRKILHVLTIAPTPQAPPFAQLSMGGDSGSVWCEQHTRRVVGLHFAGSDLPERSMAIDMQMVLDTLRVDLLVGEATSVAARAVARPGRPVAREIVVRGAAEEELVLR